MIRAKGPKDQEVLCYKIVSSKYKEKKIEASIGGRKRRIWEELVMNMI